MPTDRPSRIPLDRTLVLRAAVTFADNHGIEALSMRTLASELGVVPMALYKHVSDKDDLRGGMIDRVIGEYGTPPASSPSRAAVRLRLLSAREALLRHPWMRTAIENATRQTPAVLDHMNAVAGDLISGGHSVDLTHHAMHALGYRIWGFSPEAFAAPSATAPREAQPAAMHQMAARYPHVVAIASDAAARNPEGACDEQAEYEFTLDLLLDAFERLRDTEWSSTD
ncbi:TetR/AcrR family transcriptional regulator [Microbacterium saperdae]|uniref:TetR family transcriptional regulator n=1 Tax=Microbacterium saperdae TaxID=69368 RepID=A0A543BC85_9MICO|nr:TetR family transcriptional regulator [Microbacterium saperdae]TQL82422.1 TetR family transcriptional regulator [Microbacterium saperdae]GGM39708.1 TetR family transcriptional regulator [Microbacterium saperdae]